MFKSTTIQTATTLLLGVLLLAACSSGSKIQAPYPGLDIPFSGFNFDANRDTTIMLSNGTVITYSAGTLVDLDGNPIQGRIELSYRELHHAADIFLSGIPMEIEVQNGRGTLQTAGMFEINAHQGEKQLKIAEGRSIGMQFASRYQDDNYNLYYMDPALGTWSEIGKPETLVNSARRNALDSLDKNKPVNPLGDDLFVLNYDQLLDLYFKDDWGAIWNYQNKTKAIPEGLRAYGLKCFTQMFLNNEFRLNKGYYMGNELVWRDLDGTGFPDWLQDFRVEWTSSWSTDTQGKFETANLKVRPGDSNRYEITFLWKGKTFTKRMEAVLPLKNLFKKPAGDWQATYQEALQELEEEQKRIDMMAVTFRTFEVRNLGIYNCDRLLEQNGWYEVDPVFTFEKDAGEFKDVIIVLGDNSAVLKLPAEKTLKINPASGHRIFIPLPNNEAEVLTDASLAALPPQKPAGAGIPEVQLKMKRVKFKDQTEFRAFLGF